MTNMSVLFKLIVFNAISAEIELEKSSVNSFTSDSISVPSSADALPRFIRASVANSLQQTCQSIAAHARLVNGLYLQSSLLNPTTDPKDLVSELLNIDSKTFKELLAMDSPKVTAIIDSLKNSSTIPEKDWEVFREGLDHVSKIRNDWISVGEPSTEEERQKLYDAIEAFQNVELVDFDETIAVKMKGSLQELAQMTPNFTKEEDKIGAADLTKDLEANVENFRKFIENIDKAEDPLKQFDQLITASTMFQSTQAKISVLNEYSGKKISEMNAEFKKIKDIGLMLSQLKEYKMVLENVAVVKKLKKKGSRLDRKYTGAFPEGLAGLDLLKRDFGNSVLRTTLNNGEDISEIKTTLKPLFDFQKHVSVLNQNIRNIVNTKDLWNGCDLLENLSNKIIAAGSPTDTFNEYIMKVEATSKLAGSNTLDQSIPNFEEMNRKLAEFSALFASFSSSLSSFRSSEEFQSMTDLTGWIKALDAIMINGIIAEFNTVKNHEKAAAILRGIDKVIEKTGEFKNARAKLQANAPGLLNLKKVVDEAETSIKTNFETFISALLTVGPQIDAVQAGISFGIGLKKQFKDQNSFSIVSKALLDLDQFLEKGMRSITTEVAAVRKKEKDGFVKMMNNWEDGKKLEKGLIAGMTLFTTFEEVDRKKALLEDLMKKGKLLDEEIKGLNDSQLRDEVRKMWEGDFDAVSTKIGKMVGDVEKLKMGDDKDLKSLGATIEQAGTVTDPGVDLADWREVTEQLKGAKAGGDAPSDLATTLDSVGDLNLNFASATRFVSGISGILPGLQQFVVTRLRSSMTTTPGVTESPTFFEKHKLWLIIGGCVLAVLLLFTCIAIAICVMKKSSKKQTNRVPKVSSTTSNLQIVPLLKETTAKDKTAKKTEKGLDPTQKTDKKGVIGLDRTQDEQVDELDEIVQEQQRKLAVQLPHFQSFLENLLPSLNLVTTCVPVYKGYKASLAEFFELEIADEKRTAGQEQLSQRAKKFVMGMFKGGSSKTLNVEQRIEKETKSLQIVQPNSFITTPSGDHWYICSWPQDTNWWPEIFKLGIEHVIDLSGTWHIREMNAWSRVRDKKVNIRAIESVIPGVLLREVTHADFPMQRIRLTLFDDFPIGMAPFNYEQLAGVYMSCAHKSRPVAVVDRWGTSAACVFPMINMMIDMIGEKGDTTDFKTIGEKMLLSRRAPINMVTSIQIELAALVAFAYIEHKYSENPASGELIKGLHIDYKGSWMDDSIRWYTRWDAAFQQEQVDPMTHWFDIMTNEKDQMKLWANYKKRYVPDEKARWNIERDMKARNRNTMNRLADYGNDDLDF